MFQKLIDEMKKLNTSYQFLISMFIMFAIVLFLGGIIAGFIYLQELQAKILMEATSEWSLK